MKHIQKQLLLFFLFAQKLMCFYTENRSIFVRDWKRSFIEFYIVIFLVFRSYFHTYDQLTQYVVFSMNFFSVVVCIFFEYLTFFPNISMADNQNGKR